tara:strand:- start:3958 stop:5934 length:1977 start_codon:yes stop_codon:yes gene_type:complete
MTDNVIGDFGERWAEPVPEGTREAVLAAGYDYDQTVENGSDIDLSKTPDPKGDVLNPLGQTNNNIVEPPVPQAAPEAAPAAAPAPDPNVPKEVTEESLEQDGVFIEASRIMMEANGDARARTASDVEAAEYGKEFMGWFNYNMPYMVYKSSQLSHASNKQKLSMLYLMEKYEQKNISSEGAMRMFKGVVSDVTSWVGITTLGAGFLVGASAKQLTKQGFKAALKKSLPMALLTSAEGGLYAGVDEGLRQNVKIKAGRQKEFDLGEIAKSTAFGAAVGGVIPPLGALTGQAVKNIATRRSLQSDGTPLASNSSGDADLADINSPAAISAGTQSDPSQVTTSAPPSSVIENLATTPPKLRGAKNSSSVILSSSVIDDLLSKKRYHNDNDLSSLVTKAREQVPHLDNEIRELTDGIEGATPYPARVKDPNEIAKKLETSGKDPSQITDYVGGRIVVDDYEALSQVVKQLDDEFKIIEMDNALSVKKIGGYRALHYQLINENGYSVELQIQPREIRAVQDNIHEEHYAPFKNSKLGPLEFLNSKLHQFAAERKFKAAWDEWAVRNAEGELAYDHSKYFKNMEGSTLVPLNKLQSLESMADKGIKNAKTFMEESAAGRKGKSDPISVKKNRDGTYTILDGNSTFNNALRSNWKDIPVNIIKGD